MYCLTFQSVYYYAYCAYVLCMVLVQFYLLPTYLRNEIKGSLLSIIFVSTFLISVTECVLNLRKPTPASAPQAPEAR